MNFLNSLYNALDVFFDYLEPTNKIYSMSPDYAAYIIQKTYRNHLIKKYFKHMKHCTPNTSKRWFL